jgi:glycosyltransferase 2 family protein
VLRSLGAVGDNPLENWPLHTAVAAMSVVAGFLALIPGGLLVREVVIVELFKVALGADGTPIYGDADVVVSAVLLRLVSVVSDGLISIILYLVRPASPRPAISEGAEPPQAGSVR